MVESKNVSMFAGKAETKQGIYNVAVHDVGCHLPKCKYCTIVSETQFQLDYSVQYFLKQLYSGEKKYIHRDNIKPYSMPFVKGCTIEWLWEKIDSDNEVKKYFPDPKDRAKLPRDWITDIVSASTDPDSNRQTPSRVRPLSRTSNS